MSAAFRLEVLDFIVVSEVGRWVLTSMDTLISFISMDTINIRSQSYCMPPIQSEGLSIFLISGLFKDIIKSNLEEGSLSLMQNILRSKPDMKNLATESNSVPLLTTYIKSETKP